MRKLLGLVRRNLLIYFKDRSAVVFSMLTSIIVFVLYILFLKSNFVASINDAAAALEGIITEGDIDSFANGFLLVGILGSSMITVPYNTLSTIVKDRENGVDRDIMATPVSRMQIVLGYFIAASISSFIMTSVVLSIGLTILCCMNPMYITVSNIVLLYVTVLLGSVSGTAFFMPIMMLVNSQSVSGALMGIISAASGFVIGAYMPISVFSLEVQTVCNLFPATGITVMIRNFCLNGLLDHMNGEINGLDGGAFVEALQESFSFNGVMGSQKLTMTQTGLYVAAFTVVLLVLISVVYSKAYKKR